MANVKFLYESVSDATVSASAGSAAGYDITNIQDPNPNVIWKSPAATNNQTVVAQFAAARAVDTVIIDGINGSALSRASLVLWLQSSPDGAAWTNQVGFAGGTLANVTRLKQEIASVSQPYWRLIFIDSAGALLAAPEIGSLYLGTRFEPDIPYNESPDHGEQFTTSFSRALDKTPYASQSISDGIETWKSLVWFRVPGTIRLGFLKMSHACRGKLKPLYFIDTDATIYLVYLPDRVKEQAVMFDQYTISLEFEAFLPGTIKLT